MIIVSAFLIKSLVSVKHPRHKLILKVVYIVCLVFALPFIFYLFVVVGSEVLFLQFFTA